MDVQLHSTDKIVDLGVRCPYDGQVVYVPARIWEGTTAKGVKCHAYVTRIAVAEGDDASEFEAELVEHRKPSADVAAIPARMVL